MTAADRARRREERAVAELAHARRKVDEKTKRVRVEAALLGKWARRVVALEKRISLMRVRPASVKTTRAIHARGEEV